jgi:hypothetical protein
MRTRRRLAFQDSANRWYEGGNSGAVDDITVAPSAVASAHRSDTSARESLEAHHERGDRRILIGVTGGTDAMVAIGDQE